MIEAWRCFCEKLVDNMERGHYCYFACAAPPQEGVALIFDIAFLEKVYGAQRVKDIARCDQDIKGAGWMPWRQVAMKDAVSCEKPRGAANKRRSEGLRMGQPVPA